MMMIGMKTEAEMCCSRLDPDHTSNSRCVILCDPCVILRPHKHIIIMYVITQDHTRSHKDHTSNLRCVIAFLALLSFYFSKITQSHNYYYERTKRESTKSSKISIALRSCEYLCDCVILGGLCL